MMVKCFDIDCGVEHCSGTASDCSVPAPEGNDLVVSPGTCLARFLYQYFELALEEV